jgi:hypothetical protein
MKYPGLYQFEKPSLYLVFIQTFLPIFVMVLHKPSNYHLHKNYDTIEQLLDRKGD